MSAVIAATGALATVAGAAAFTILGYYAITNLAALRLTATQRRFPRAIAGFGLVGCIALAVFLDREVVAVGLVVVAAGVAWRVLFRAL